MGEASVRIGRVHGSGMEGGLRVRRSARRSVLVGEPEATGEGIEGSGLWPAFPPIRVGMGLRLGRDRQGVDAARGCDANCPVSLE